MDVLDNMDMYYEDNSDIEDEDEAGDDFVHLALMVAFPRRSIMIREQPDHATASFIAARADFVGIYTKLLLEKL